MIKKSPHYLLKFLIKPLNNEEINELLSLLKNCEEINEPNRNVLIFAIRHSTKSVQSDTLSNENFDFTLLNYVLRCLNPISLIEKSAKGFLFRKRYEVQWLITILGAVWVFKNQISKAVLPSR
ncbi:MAG: hypothetical protein ACJAV5_000713 [Vicingaceae bacterium]|jgi:hypothetical protein